MRWYSEQPAAKEGEAAPAQQPATEQPSGQANETAQLKEQLQKKDKEVLDWKVCSPCIYLQCGSSVLINPQDKYLRSVADYRNLQDRTQREIKAAKDFALQRFARDLVDSVDNLDRALTTVPPEKLSEGNDLKQLHDGIKMTEGILMSTLKKHGLERFDPSESSEKFNPNVHEAVFQTPQPDKEDGTVFHTQQKGFMLNGRVLRAAKVGVVKNS